jgi:TolB-like protein/tetratricopeptide (TPR) repeat protein
MRAVLIAIVMLLLASPALASRTLAVTYFDNNTSDAQWTPLGRGLADMLITDLSRLDGLEVVERARINDLLAELQLADSGFIDPATASKMGKGLGAQFVLTGSFSTVSPQMRIDARVVEVETGRVLHSVSSTGAATEFFLLEKEIANDIIAGLGVKPNARELAKLGRVQTESFDAFVAFSTGLVAIDRGALEEAQRALELALSHDDRFDLAKSALDGLSERLRAARSVRSERMSERVTQVVAALEAHEAKKGTDAEFHAILQPLMMEMYGYPLEDRREIASRILDLDLPETVVINPAVSQSVNEWAMHTYVMSAFMMGNRAQTLTYGEAFLTRYPTSPMFQGVQNFVQQTADHIRKEADGREEATTVDIRARAAGLEHRCHHAVDPNERLTVCRDWAQLQSGHGLEVDADAYTGWARAAVKACAWDEPAQAAAGLAKHDPYHKEVSVIEGLVRRGESHRAGAIKAARDLMQADDRVHEFTNPADKLIDACEYAAATAALDDAARLFPDEAKVWRVRIDLELHRANHPGAQKALAGWEASGVPVQATAARWVQQFPEKIARAEEAKGHESMVRARLYYEAYQHEKSADAYLELAEKYPDYGPIGKLRALELAANAMMMAKSEAVRPRLRALYERLMTDYPDSEEANRARSMMTAYFP